MAGAATGKLDMLKVASACRDNLLMGGFEVEERGPNSDLVSEVGEFGKTGITPKMDPTRTAHSGDDCFWLVLQVEGESVGCIGCLRERIGQESFVEYWARSTRVHYPNHGAASYDHLDPELVANLSGTTAYIGELFIKKEYRGNSAVLVNFLLLAHVYSSFLWDWDCSYAFFRDRDARACMGQLYHFSNAVRDFQRWENAPPGRSSSEVLFMLPRRQLSHLIRYYRDFPIELSI